MKKIRDAIPNDMWSKNCPAKTTGERTITKLSWDAAYAIAEAAKREAERLALLAAQELTFKPANEKAAAYFAHVKECQAQDSAALYAFAREVIELAGPSTSQSFTYEGPQKA